MPDGLSVEGRPTAREAIWGQPMSSDESTETGARFTFYPAVRTGYRPLSADGETAVEVTVTGDGDDGEERDESVTMPIHLYGPGDVTGIDRRQIIRREPRPRTEDHAPPQYPVIEFSRPDLPWLFSPEARGDHGRLRPWLTLAVVNRDDGNVGYEPVGPGDLPVLEAPLRELPDPAESWAWAHAQQTGVDDEGDIPDIDIDSSYARSRVVGPRHLEEKTRYRACLIPTYERGRLTGLGQDPDDSTAGPTALWGESLSAEDTLRLPVYDSWTFITASEGDFATLARDLEPTTFGTNIGVRTVDVSKPGPHSLKQPGYDDASTVGLEGALLSPAFVKKKRNEGLDDGYDETLTGRLETLLSRAEELDDELDERIVSPPLYGRWHAERSTFGPDDWFDQLNLDPRYRIAAGFGTTVVQGDQESLMASAWEQFGDLDLVNEFLKRSQLAKEAQESTYEDVKSMELGRKLQFAKPCLSNVIVDDRKLTAMERLEDIDAPIGMLETTFRSVTSPTASLARRRDVTLTHAGFGAHLEHQTTVRDEELVTGFVPLSDVDEEIGGHDDVAGDVGGGSDRFDRFPDQDLIGDSGFPIAEDIQTGGRDSQTDDPEMQTDELDIQSDKSEEGINPRFLSTAYTGDSSADERVTDDLLEEDPFEETREERDARERTLQLLHGVERHCQSARTSVASLESAVSRASDDRTLRGALEGELGPATRRCERIVPYAVEPVSVALAKLLVEPRPATIDAALTREAAERELERLRTEAKRVENQLAAIAHSHVSSDTDSRPREIRSTLGEAGRSLSRMIEIVSSMRSRLGTAHTKSQSKSGLDAGPTENEEPGLDILQSSRALLADDEVRDELEEIDEVVTEALDPAERIPALVATRTGLSVEDVRNETGELLLDEVMPSPTFDWPMSTELTALETEYLLPGVGEIERDVVGLLKTNSAFIQAYMAGLNHEMARLLRWRRYPTDRRGTYFREFWDHAADPYTESTDLESKADIDDLHEWEGDLGSGVRGEASLVMLVRGDLFRRYPNTVVYAAKATRTEDDGRVPETPKGSIEDADTSEKPIEFPAFRGSLGSDIEFFGFDLTLEDAHDGEGWFFVLEEPPAEHRFGLVGDVYDREPEADAGEYVSATELPAWIGDQLADIEAKADSDGVDLEDIREVWEMEETGSGEDAGPLRFAAWRPGPTGEREWTEERNGAHVANVTYRIPTRVAIHASKMLPEPDGDSAGSGDVGGEGGGGGGSSGSDGDSGDGDDTGDGDSGESDEGGTTSMFTGGETREIVQDVPVVEINDAVARTLEFDDAEIGGEDE